MIGSQSVIQRACSFLEGSSYGKKKSREGQRERELKAEKTNILFPPHPLSQSQHWASSLWANFPIHLFSATHPSLNAPYLANHTPHSSLPWAGICFMGNGLVKPCNVHKELSTIQHDLVYSLGKSGCQHHLPCSLRGSWRAAVMAFASLHCSSKAQDPGREEQGTVTVQWVGWGCLYSQGLSPRTQVLW